MFCSTSISVFFYPYQTTSECGPDMVLPVPVIQNAGLSKEAGGHDSDAGNSPRNNHTTQPTQVALVAVLLIAVVVIVLVVFACGIIVSIIHITNINSK